MYKIPEFKSAKIEVNQSKVGETIETKVKRIVENKEPIKDGAPIIFTERKDGVLPAYNPKTDKFDLAIDAKDYISRSNTAKRQQSIEERNKMKISGTDSVEGTNEQAN